MVYTINMNKPSYIPSSCLVSYTKTFYLPTQMLLILCLTLGHSEDKKKTPK